MSLPDEPTRIAVIIPCYKVRKLVMSVIASIGPEVTDIICVDDACPEQSGQHIQASNTDNRVSVIFNQNNLGVGGATTRGYVQAMENGADIIVKLDGDGQMDPRRINDLIEPLRLGYSDYAKGNRFFYREHLVEMPPLRVFGNLVLSFITKLSTGYWNVFDPTNGFTAIKMSVLKHIPLHKLSNRFFFESDMLFRLSILRAVVHDVPMPSQYGNEKSNLQIANVIPEFLLSHMVNLYKRILYGYFLRDFNIASVELILGAAFFAFGSIYGGIYWNHSMQTGVPASAGTVMLAALPVMISVQLVLAFLNFDIQNTPEKPIHPFLERLSSVKLGYKLQKPDEFTTSRNKQ